MTSVAQEMTAMGSYALEETLPDEDLVRRCRGCEEAAFSQLYRRYLQPVLCTAYRIIRNVEDARGGTNKPDRAGVFIFGGIRSYNAVTRDCQVLSR